MKALSSGKDYLAVPTTSATRWLGSRNITLTVEHLELLYLCSNVVVVMGMILVVVAIKPLSDSHVLYSWLAQGQLILLCS